MSTAALPGSACLDSVRHEPAALTCRGWLRDGIAIGLVLALQLVYFTGVIASDDTIYCSYAFKARAGEPFGVQAPECYAHYQSIVFARFVYWRLVQAAVTILPGRVWAIALPSLASSIALLLIIRGLARRFLPPRLALAPMLIYGLIPLNVALATVGLPDVTGTALSWLGIGLAAAPLLDRDAKWAAGRALTGGLLLAAAWNVREAAVFFIPGLMLFVLIARRREVWAWKRAAILCAGTGLGVAIESLLLWRWTGDPLFHFRVIPAAQRAFNSAPWVELTASALLMYWTDYMRWLLDPGSAYGPMGPLLLAGLLYVAVKRPILGTLVLCCTVPGLIYISLGSTEIRDYFPVYHQPRYLILFLPGLALMAGWMIGQLWQWRATGRWAVVVMALLMLKPTLTGPDELAGRAYNARTFAGGYDLAERHLAPAGRADRLIASAISRDRFVNLHHWSDCPPVERIDTPAPRTQEQWIERYAGAYVLTTWKDRRGPYDPAQASSTLHGAPMESLSRFEHVARYEPARSRLQLIRAHLLGRPVPTEPARAVDLWRVPARGERRSESPAGAGGSLGGSPRVANAGHKES